MPRFEPHGDFRLELDGQIIKNFATGSANREAVQDFAREMDALLAELGGKPFATYAEYGPDVLLTPDAAEVLHAHMADRVARGQVAAALNLSRAENRIFVQNQIGRICDELGLPWRVFASYEDARTWLLHRIELANGEQGEPEAEPDPFPPHGDYRIETEGRIIVVTAAGATNREAIQRYRQQVAEIVAGFGGRPFAIYSVYNNDVILTHEAEQKLQQSIDERVRRGMCAAAFNVSNSIHPKFITAQIGELYDAAGVPWRTFEDDEAAKSWLKDRILAAEESSRT